MGTVLIAKSEVHRFIKECIMSAGANSDSAQTLADVLTEADYRGHFSHGMNRLHMYLRDLENKVTNPIVQEQGYGYLHPPLNKGFSVYLNF